MNNNPNCPEEINNWDEVVSRRRGLIAGYKPNRLSLYILLLTTGRLSELEKTLYKDMEKYKEEK